MLFRSAPKILWLDSSGYPARDRHIYECDTKYIRADIVEEMRKALLGLIADFVINGYTDDDIEKARVALKRLEEE